MHALELLIYQTDPWTLLGFGAFIGCALGTIVQVGTCAFLDRKERRS